MAKWKSRSNFPIFDPSNFYSYFTDLINRSTGYSNIDRIRAALYRNAAYYYSSSIYDELSFEAK